MDQRHPDDGKIAVMSIPEPRRHPSSRPRWTASSGTGVAKEPSLSQDATRIAWTDGGGLKVAGAPDGAADRCALALAPVTISATGRTPRSAAPTSPCSSPRAAPAASCAGARRLRPRRRRAGSTSASRSQAQGDGSRVPVTVSGPGKVTLTATVPAKAMGKKGKPVKIGSGSANATAAGKVTVKLKLTAAAKKRLEAQGHEADAHVHPERRTSTKTISALSASVGGRASFCRVKERIEDLARQITELRAAYYDGDTKVADAEYDALEEELRTLLVEHPELTPDPNPLEQVGAPIGAARAGAALAADAVVGEGDRARAGRRVPRSLPGPAGGRDAQARRASRWRSSTRTGGSRGRSRAATGRPART